MDKFLEDQLEEAFDSIFSILWDDEIFLRSRPVPERSRVIYLLGSLYIRYIVAVNKMIMTHKYMLHPNKRPFIASVIEKILGRILEIKHEMVEVEISDFQYLNSIIICNYTTRKNAQLVIPIYYQTQREELLAQLNEKIDKITYVRDHPELFATEEDDDEDGRSSTRKSRKASRKSSRRSRASTTKKSADEEEEEIRKQEEEEERIKKDEMLKKRPKFAEVQVYEFFDEIKLIQRHERARAARVYVQAVRERLRTEYEKAWHIYKPIPEDLLYGVTRVIQRHWKKYRQKRIEKYENVQRCIIYGTLTPSYTTTVNISDLLKERQIHQKELEKAMAEAMEYLSLNLEGEIKDDIKDDMLEEMRIFIKTWYECTKEFGYTELPEWPPDNCFVPPFQQLGIPEGLPKDYLKENFPEVPNDLGGQQFPALCGSEFISAGHWIAPEQWPPAAHLARTIQKEGKPAVDPKKAAQEKEAAKERAEKEKEEAERRMEELRRMGHVPWKSTYCKDVKLASKDYLGEFGTGKDLIKNPKQEHDEEILKSQLVYQLRKNLRQEVDQEIRYELEGFQNAVDIDEAGRKKAPKLPKKKKHKEKKKKKKKEKKDPTGNRTIESLFEDLVEDGLVIKYDEVLLKSLPGEYNHHGQAERAMSQDPMPSIADVYQVANEYITIPLGSKELRERTPSIKSVLFAGPNSFTHPLVHAIAYASGAVLFYLPALDFYCRYKGKIFLNVMTKVTAEYQPSIIFVDGAEKPFYKKVPKEEKELKPGALKGVLAKLVKGLKANDRVIVIGTAESPWMSKAGPMMKVFQKVLPFSECDYHSTSKVVQQTIMKYHGVDREFNTAVPAYMFLGQPLSDIEQRLDSIFNLERILSLKYQPLTVLETGCIEKEPPKPSPLEQWYKNNYPLCKQRKGVIQAEIERKEKEAKVKKPK